MTIDSIVDQPAVRAAGTLNLAFTRVRNAVGKRLPACKKNRKKKVATICGDYGKLKWLPSLRN
jgi:hypothetical protein